MLIPFEGKKNSAVPTDDTVVWIACMLSVHDMAVKALLTFDLQRVSVSMKEVKYLGVLFTSVYKMKCDIDWSHWCCSSCDVDAGLVILKRGA